MSAKNRLLDAIHHVTAGQHVLADQRARIVRMAKAGRDVTDVEQLLDLFQQTLVIFEADLRAIEEELPGSGSK